MTFTTKQFGKRLSRQTRRAIAALVIAGSIVSSSLGSAPPAQAFDTHDSYGANAHANGSVVRSGNEDKDAINERPDYWIFSNDYCGWASVEAFTAPYSVNPLATEPCRPAANRNALLGAASVVDQTLSGQANEKPESLLDTAIAIALANITVSKSIAGSPKVKVVKPGPVARLIGSAPIVVSISEGYLPYDLSRADQIALRMYPIAIPQFRYVGGRRTNDPLLADCGPLDCFGNGVIWNEEVLPSQSISVVPSKIEPPQSTRWTSALEPMDTLRRLISAAAEDLSAQSDEDRRSIALAMVDAVQPKSRLRNSIAPGKLGVLAASSLVSVHTVANDQLENATRSLAAGLKRGAPETRAERLESSVGERLLVRAGIEVNALDCATAGVADVVQDKVCCPVERYDLAVQLPASHHWAAVGVAAATLEMPHEPRAVRDAPVGSGAGGLAHAEALATACDHAAATLERFALALRRAGDSAVRVAKAASAEAGTALR